MTTRRTTKSVDSDLCAMPGNLAKELETASSHRKSRYQTHNVVTRSDVGFATNDLGNKWGDDSENPRQTPAGQARREPVHDSPLNRHIADFYCHVTRIVEKLDNPNESQLTTPALENSTREFSEDISHLSGELVDEEWRLSGELATRDSSGGLVPEELSAHLSDNLVAKSGAEMEDTSAGEFDTRILRGHFPLERDSSGELVPEKYRLSGELAARDSSSGLVPEELSAHLSDNLVAKSGAEMEGGSLVLHPNLSRLQQHESSDDEAQLGPRDNQLSEDDYEVEYLPTRASIEPPRLPEIDTSDDEDLVDELLSKLRDISDMEYEPIHVMAVILELGGEETKKGASSPRLTTEMEGGSIYERKGKNVDPLETGPRYSGFKPKLKKLEKKKASESNSLFHQRPEHFRRDDSEKPDGGWFRATTKKADPSPPPSSSDSESDEGNGHGPPSPPGPDSSENESDDSSVSSKASPKGRNHKKTKKTSMKNIKMKDPFEYNGTADLDIFDQWTFEVDTYCNWYEIGPRTSVQFMVKWTSGKASQFMMKHVVRDIKKWDRQLVYEGLFDYCFPSHFKLELRERMMSAVQGPMSVRDYARELEAMAVRFPDVTNREVTQIFWQGMRQDLRLNLIEKGMNPERTGFEKLVKYAQRREDAIETKKREERKWKGQATGRRWGRFVNRVDEAEPIQLEGTGLYEEELPETDEPAENMSAPNTGTETQHSQRRDFRKTARSRMSEEERDRLRAEQRCFSCEDVGHESRNCPKRRQAKAPTINAGAVNFSSVQVNDDYAREVDLQINMVHFPTAEMEGGSGMPENGDGPDKNEERLRLTSCEYDEKAAEETPEAVGRTAMHPKDFRRVIPKPIILTVDVNGQPIHALLDTGSMADFVSTTIVDQLKLPLEVLAGRTNVQLAVHSSHSKINCSVTVNFKYQGINEKRRFDVVNLHSYDMILGTPFLYQHQVLLGLNPTRVVVGSTEALGMCGEELDSISSAATESVENDLQSLPDKLVAEARFDKENMGLSRLELVMEGVREMGRRTEIGDSGTSGFCKPIDRPDIGCSHGCLATSTATGRTRVELAKQLHGGDGTTRLTKRLVRKGSRKPSDGTQPTEAQKPHASGTQDDSPKGAARGCGCFTRRDHARSGAETLIEDVDSDTCMDVDEPLAPGWGDTRDVDDGMAAAKP